MRKFLTGRKNGKTSFLIWGNEEKNHNIHNKLKFQDEKAEIILKISVIKIYMNRFNS